MIPFIGNSFVDWIPAWKWFYNVLLSRASINSNLNLHDPEYKLLWIDKKIPVRSFFSSGKLTCFGMRHLPHLSVAAWQQINHCINLIGQDLRDDLVPCALLELFGVCDKLKPKVSEILVRIGSPKLPFRRAFANHSRPFAPNQLGTGRCYHVFERVFRAKGLHGNFKDCPAGEAQIETTLKGSWSCKLQGKLYKPFWARVGSWQSLTPTFRKPSTNHLPRTFRRFLAYKSEF